LETCLKSLGVRFILIPIHGKVFLNNVTACIELTFWLVAYNILGRVDQYMYFTVSRQWHKFSSIPDVVQCFSPRHFMFLKCKTKSFSTKEDM